MLTLSIQAMTDFEYHDVGSVYTAGTEKKLRLLNRERSCLSNFTGRYLNPEGPQKAAPSFLIVSLEEAAAAMATLLGAQAPGEKEGGRVAAAGKGPGESLPAPAEERHS
ncbi:hypothetical protein [Mesorhizobium comanense]|uniref:hypothetical protein n=1 Tax=Mesorhizobium comanense TaxID=2502215 RepID=UPI0010F8BF0A|nr:hypothetical protein [Mesorhizobium comanense]